VAGRLRSLTIAVGAFLLIGVGFFFLRGPKPHIEIKAEKLFSLPGFDITNTLFTSWIVVVLLIVLAFLATRNMKLIPTGFQNAVEAIIEMLYTLVQNTVGDKHARRFFPVIATIFLYIMISNWSALLPIFNTIGKVEEIHAEGGEFHDEAAVFKEVAGISMIMPNTKSVEIHVDESPCNGTSGDEHEECIVHQREEAILEARERKHLGEDEKLAIMAPYFRSVNTDLMSPLSLAIASAIFVEYWGISTLGVLGYGSKFFNFRRISRGDFMGVIDIFVGILEFIAEIARLISFTFRLFGNMLAGEILLLVMTFLIPLLLALPFYGLELFVGVIQAFVFAMLTLVFGALAVTSHDDHGEESHASSGAAAAHGAE
jgi:F-type H+-transporting ATPase subunit a